MSAKVDFVVDRIDGVTMTGNTLVSQRDLMSPYVWQTARGQFGMLVRAVPRAAAAADLRVRSGRR